MRTIDFSEILFNALQYSGNDRHNINSETFAQFRDFISARMREVWEMEEWPDLCRVAEFTTIIDPVTNVPYFTPITNVDVLGVFNKNPQTTSRAVELNYQLYGTGTSTRIILDTNAHATGWYYYRVPFRPLLGDLWDSSIPYFQNAQAYYDAGSSSATYTPVAGRPHNGNFYFLNAVSATAGNLPTSSSWSRISIPYIFGNYCAWGAAANWLVSEGQLQEAAGLDGKAQSMIQIELDKILKQMNQNGKIKFFNPYKS
jgi:hypothetical protein